MKFIENILFIDLKNKKREILMVNLLNGLVDVIGPIEFALFSEWKNDSSFITHNEHEEKLYKTLKERKYIMSATEEQLAKEEIIKKVKEQQEYTINNCGSATFVLTYNCNFACPYCYEQQTEETNKIMTEEMVDAVIARYPRGIYHVGLFGGEPLLPSHKEIIKYIIAKIPNAQYTAVTNGYYLSEYLEFFKQVKTAMIQVTLDGTKDTHNKTRFLKNGKPTYDVIMSGIEKYLENKIPIKIRMNISKENYEDCYNLRNQLLAKFKQYEEILSFEMQPLFQYKNEERHDLIQKIINEDKNSLQLSDGVRVNQILATLPALADFFRRGGLVQPVINFCNSETQNRFYDANGDIYSCILAVRNKNKSIGKYFPATENKPNSMLHRNIFSIEKCSKCQYALICGGGCPNEVIGADGNALIPNCNNLKEQIHTLIPLLYKLKYGDRELG